MTSFFDVTKWSTNIWFGSVASVAKNKKEVIIQMMKKTSIKRHVLQQTR